MYKGPYKISERSRLGRLVNPGEIIIHKLNSGTPSGALILNCPKCGGFQHTVNTVEGPHDAPTITKQITCGCVRCKVTFRIRSGRAHFAEVDKPDDPQELSEDMKAFNVFYTSEEKKK
jgi:hypothetical protein